jgi:hypothetical protein
MRQHRILNPVQITGIVYMAHKINIIRRNADGVLVRESGCHICPNGASLF